MRITTSRALRGSMALLLCGLAAACAYERPQSTVSPNLESGITSQNGGGTRALGNTLNEGVTTRVTPAPASSGLPRSVDADRGGGMRALGDIPNVGVTTRTPSAY